MDRVVALPRHGAVLGYRGNFEQKRRHLEPHFSHVASPTRDRLREWGPLTCHSVCGLTTGSDDDATYGVLIIILDLCGGNKDVCGLCMMMRCEIIYSSAQLVRALRYDGPWLKILISINIIFITAFSLFLPVSAHIPYFHPVPHTLRFSSIATSTRSLPLSSRASSFPH